MKLPVLSKTYQGKTVLDLPSLELEEGLIHAVIGANGCGKSTFARILAGAIPSDDGLLDLGIQRGYMPQRNYAFQMTVLRNLMLGGGDKAAALAMLERFGLSSLAEQNGKKLSGGETARMAMGRLLMQDYPLLILDEPTAAMDVTAALRAEDILLEYQKRVGCTVVLVTHSLKQARRLADQVLFFKEGHLVEQGGAEEVLNRPRHPDTKEFLDFYRI